ncbi:MAG: ATPase [Sphingorhabdus sp.]|jgi:chaperone required for assembly of F1-ATPase|uniref:ATP12 family chaperone protein n=2 Tax=Sphingorhabdus sp. TaxID=1902408 RepID=UPI00273DAF2A|nr:ATP12 family protein [Sphingorhabdus sp.]MDP4757972.1 ATPase [Sphingorhabdus sp.]MDP4872084.1 ATPase [Sphingorhabdus sp.]MDP4927716.1 ATPase [Sphingorhabdus sp.]
MRRFWKAVTLEPSDYGYAVRLDGRPVKTPTGNLLALPSQKMADAVVAEWEAVEKNVNPVLMPNTGFANAAIDRIAPDHDGFAAAIAAYGETDNFCYRAAAGEALADRQAQIWDPWLDWAKGRYDIEFLVVEGIMHQPQPAATLKTLRSAVAARGAFELAAMAKLAHLSGSLVATLAIIERAGTAEDIWKAACLDEIWQEELWGADHWAQKNRSDREGEFMAAVRFLDLLIAET